jgi:hypothetical protein
MGKEAMVGETVDGRDKPATAFHVPPRLNVHFRAFVEPTKGDTLAG